MFPPSPNGALILHKAFFPDWEYIIMVLPIARGVSSNTPSPLIGARGYGSCINRTRYDRNRSIAKAPSGSNCDHRRTGGSRPLCIVAFCIALHSGQLESFEPDSAGNGASASSGYQFGLQLPQPVRHAHLAVIHRCGPEVLAGLRAPAAATAEPGEIGMAPGGEGPHAELLATRQCLPQVIFGHCELPRIGVERSRAEQAKGPSLVGPVIEKYDTANPHHDENNTPCQSDCHGTSATML